MKKLVLCDVDEVLAEQLPEWLKFYNKDYDDNLKAEDLACWDLSTHVKPECGKKISEYLRREDMYDNARQVSGALKGIESLRHMGYTVKFVSSSNPAQYRHKFNWLVRHGFVEDHSNDVIFCHDKYLLRGDFMIDDAPHNVESWSELNPGGQALLFNQPHNRNYVCANENITRISCWNSVVTFAQLRSPIVCHRY